MSITVEKIILMENKVVAALTLYVQMFFTIYVNYI